MTITQFAEDLSKPGHGEEPKESSNAGMNLSLLLALVFSAAIVIWALTATHGVNSGAPAVAPATPLATPHSTYFNGKTVQTNHDKSYDHGQELQMPAPGNSSSYQ